MPVAESIFNIVVELAYAWEAYLFSFLLLVMPAQVTAWAKAVWVVVKLVAAAGVCALVKKSIPDKTLEVLLSS